MHACMMISLLYICRSRVKKIILWLLVSYYEIKIIDSYLFLYTYIYKSLDRRTDKEFVCFFVKKKRLALGAICHMLGNIIYIISCVMYEISISAFCFSLLSKKLEKVAPRNPQNLLPYLFCTHAPTATRTNSVYIPTQHMYTYIFGRKIRNFYAMQQNIIHC